MDNAEDRDTSLDQADIDREIAAAFDELARTVEGVHQPEIVARELGQPVIGAIFFGNDRQAWVQRPQRAQDDRLRRPVGHGHGRRVGLGIDCERTALNLENGPAGFVGNRKQAVGPGGEKAEVDHAVFAWGAFT